jgi:chromosome segregation ATPase
LDKFGWAEELDKQVVQDITKVLAEEDNELTRLAGGPESKTKTAKEFTAMFKGKAGLTQIMKDAIERVIKAKEELDEILVDFENLKTEYDEVYEEYAKLAKKLKDHDDKKGTLFSQEDIDKFAELKKKLADLKAQMKKTNMEYKKAMAKYTAAKAAAKTTM